MLMNAKRFEEWMFKYTEGFHSLVPLQANDTLLPLNLTASNADLTAILLKDTAAFTHYIQQQLAAANATYGYGGYAENRTVYQRSNVFDGKEPRTLHLGLDIWGAAGTTVFAPLGGMVHSFAFNKAFGDYGATIILLHQLEGIPFYTLYGHLSLQSLASLTEGKYISRGEAFASFGVADENGFWPPHLHFQIILDMELKEGDYPGVCAYSERDKYLNNCPNPAVIAGKRFL